MASSPSSSSLKSPKAKHPLPRPLQLPDLANAGGPSPNSAGISPSGFGASISTPSRPSNGAMHYSSSPISSSFDALTSPPPPSSYPNHQRNGHAHTGSLTSSSRPQSRTGCRNSGAFSATAGIPNGHGSSSSPGNSTPIRSPTSSKRQSTISYFSPDQEASRERDWKRLSAASAGLVSGGGRRSTSQNRDSLGSVSALGLVDDAALEKERPKLTLVEQHAELLHSIASKEAQCLELRTQLATNEEELAHLKRKWERIVNRGPDRENHMANSNTAALLSQASPLSPLASGLTGTSIVAFGLGMEGLKGGVQEMGRLLSVGLTSAAGASAAVAHSRPPSRQDSSLAPSPSLRPASISRGPSPLPGGVRLERGSSQRHKAKESSNSSSSTNQSSRTTATSVGSAGLGNAKARHRLSQCSSATSYDGLDDDDRLEVKEGDRLTTPQTKNTITLAGKKDSSHNSPQELIIMDTGATPTMSPNPAFLEQKERRRQRKDREDEEEQARAGKPASVAATDDDPWDVWGNGSDAPSPSVSPVPGSFASMQTKALSSSDVESASVAAGSASRGTAGGIGQGWMDTVGKKLGELQKSSTVSALSKSQKRASLMLSDMGQTIASALTDPGTPSSRPLTQSPLSPPLASAPSRGQGKAHNLTLARALSSNMTSSSQTPTLGASLLTPPPSSSRASPSLLDDDDDDIFGKMIAAKPVLTPDKNFSGSAGVTSALKSSESSTKLERRRSAKASSGSKRRDDETDGLEWGW